MAKLIAKHTDCGNEIMFQDTIYFDLSLLKESDKCFKCGKQITKDNLINITNGTPKGK